MTELHQTPRFGQIVREQFSATALSLRPYVSIGIVIGAVATFLAYADYFRRGVGTEFAPQMSLIPALAGIVLPVVLWQKERLFGAGFLWTLPIERTRQAFAKVFAGWLCLMIPIAAFVLWFLVLALTTKGNITSDEMVRVLPTPEIPPPGTLDPSLLQTIRWIPHPAFWFAPFTAGTAAYALMSGIMLGLRYPFRWIIGVIAGGFLIAAVGQGIESDAFWTKMQSVIQPLIEGPYGLDAVLSARSESLHTSVVLANGVYTSVWRALPVVSDWIIATLLWTGLGITGLCAALFRHRDQR